MLGIHIYPDRASFSKYTHNVYIFYTAICATGLPQRKLVTETVNSI